ncbi:MAG: hypothetical protein HC818_07110 [Synechococcaceae cyanobacterium RM1_1_27]|nr:hypothetical protein [Synechococcaceae cyanobacterium SM2_3_2]NJO86316.1 hypothetical protein [Synechococcaceae cyanobacterium RM1_1_27]
MRFILILLLIAQAAQANPYQNRIQLLEDQIQLLQFQQDQLIRRRDAERILRGSILIDSELPPQWLTLQRQILTLQADIETEKLREEQSVQQQQQREQEQAQREQAEMNREEQDRLVNQRMTQNLQDLLLLQQQELDRLQAEYRQTLPAYRAGLISENQWNALQRGINSQTERIQRTQSRIAELTPLVP